MNLKFYKKALYLLILLFLFSSKMWGQVADSSNYIVLSCNVVRIDSVGDVYLIFTEGDVSKDKYKIFSRKDSLACENIVVSQSYEFTFYDPWASFKTINSLMYPIKQCVFDGNAIIYVGNWGSELYEALEIRGLCYDKKHIELYKLNKERYAHYSDSVQKVVDNMSFKEYLKHLERNGFPKKNSESMTKKERKIAHKKSEKYHKIRPRIPEYIEDDAWLREEK